MTQQQLTVVSDSFCSCLLSLTHIDLVFVSIFSACKHFITWQPLQFREKSKGAYFETTDLPANINAADSSAKNEIDND